MNGRVFSAGFSKRGSKTPLFTPGVGGATARHTAPTTASAAVCPNNKGCARTGLAQETLRFGRRRSRWDGRKISWKGFSRLHERARFRSRFPEKGVKKPRFHPWYGRCPGRDAESAGVTAPQPLIASAVLGILMLWPRTGQEAQGWGARMS